MPRLPLALLISLDLSGTAYFKEERDPTVLWPCRGRPQYEKEQTGVGKWI